MKANVWSAILAVTALGALSGCASEPYYWQKQSWARLDVDDAHMACAEKAKFETNTQKSFFDDSANNPYGKYMKECMNSRGFTLVHGREPKVEQKAEQKNEATRGTASTP